MSDKQSVFQFGVITMLAQIIILLSQEAGFLGLLSIVAAFCALSTYILALSKEDKS